jgi:hypothetical protein
MSFKMLTDIFSKKNMNFVVGLITLFIVLWVVMFAVPGLFVSLFNTFLGNAILLTFIVLAAMFNVNLAVGLAVVFLVLFRFSQMSGRSEPFIPVVA